MKAFFSILALSSAVFACDAPPPPAPTKAAVNTNYNNRLYFVEGYERIEKNSCYFGIIGWISPNYLSSSDSWLVEGEARLGYTADFKKHTTFTVFGAGGYLNDFKRSHTHTRAYLRHMKEHTLEYAYGAIGLNTNHEFNALFNLGLNLKGMVGKGTIGSRFHDNEWTYGIDVGLPLTFRFGYQRRYDIAYEPFYIFLKSNYDESSYLGNRLFISYRY